VPAGPLAEVYAAGADRALTPAALEAAEELL
jgi:hypothetical protein